MSEKFDETSTKTPAFRPAVIAESDRQGAVNLRVFRVKLPLQTPLDFAVAQLYRSWPKPRPRRDN